MDPRQGDRQGTRLVRGAAEATYIPGMVHDVGKVTIPVEIFSRPGSGRVQVHLTWPDVSKQGAHGHARIPLEVGAAPDDSGREEWGAIAMLMLQNHRHGRGERWRVSPPHRDVPCAMIRQDLVSTSHALCIQ